MDFYKVIFLFFCGLLISACNNSNHEEYSIGIAEKSLSADDIVYESHIISHEGDDGDWYENLPEEKRKNFITTLLELIRQEKVNAYKTSLGEPTQLPEYLISYKDVLDLLRDTVIIQGEVKQVPFNIQKLSQITFVENWKFDAEKLVFHKQVKGLAISKEVYNDEGLFMGYSRLFWVWFNKNKQ